jgi:hypothetical protein
MWITIGWMDGVSWMFSFQVYVCFKYRWMETKYLWQISGYSMNNFAWQPVFVSITVKHYKWWNVYVYNQLHRVRLEVPTAVNIKIMVFWDVTPCSLANGYKCSRATCCRHLLLWCYAQLYLLLACVNLSSSHFWCVVAWTTKSVAHVVLTQQTKNLV